MAARRAKAKAKGATAGGEGPAAKEAAAKRARKPAAKAGEKTSGKAAKTAKAAKKTAAKTAKAAKAAKKTAAKTAKAAKAGKKTAAKTAKAAKKTVAKKTVAKKTVAKKTVAKKTVAKQTASRVKAVASAVVAKVKAVAKAVVRGAKRRAAPARVDLHAFNSSPVMLIAARGALGKEIDTATPEWHAAVAAGDLLAIDLGMDASIDMRVVVGDALTPEEEAASIARLEHHLRLPDGKLVVVGGIELMIEEHDAGELEDSGDERVLDVAPGEYRATLHALVTGPFGADLLERAGHTEPAGAWWRRTRGAEPMPEWVRARCRAAPAEQDPGHEAEWINATPPRSAAPEVDWLLHLEPLAGEPPAVPRLDNDGFAGLEAFTTRPLEACPASIAMDPDARGAEPRPADAAEPDEVPLPPPVFERARERPLTPIAGGPVELALRDLVAAVRLTWFPSNAADPELRLEPAPGGALPAFPPTEGVVARPESGGLRIAFRQPGGGNPFAWELGARGWPESAARALAGLALDGATLELCSAPHPIYQDRGDGWMRLRGDVVGGVWRIALASPAVDARTLGEALALSAEVGHGELLRCDAAEAEALLRKVETGGVVLFGNDVVAREGGLGLAAPSAEDLGTLARPLFDARFGHVWPKRPAAGDDDDE